MRRGNFGFALFCACLALVIANIVAATIAARCRGETTQQGVALGYGFSATLVLYASWLGRLWVESPSERGTWKPAFVFCLTVAMLIFNIFVIHDVGACVEEPGNRFLAGSVLSAGLVFSAFEMGMRDEIRRQERLRELEAAEEPPEIKVAAAG